MIHLEAKQIMAPKKKTKSANFIATPIQRQHEIIGPSEK